MSGLSNMKTTSVWVVTLVGEHVHHGYSIQGVIERINDLCIIREKIKETYEIEFESENSARGDFKSFYQTYDNITDERDITLVLSRTVMYQNDDFYHINNLISLAVEATVDAVKGTLPEERFKSHLANRELYGDLPEEVYRHIINCVLTVASAEIMELAEQEADYLGGLI